MTKKAAALLLAASLAVSVCAMPVFATDYNMGSTSIDNTKATGAGGVATGNTDVHYKVTESYTWSVPITIDFGENAGANNTSTVEAKLGKDDTGEKAKKAADNKWKGTAPKIVVSKNVIGIGKQLQITVNTSYYDNHEFYVLSGTSEKLYYTVTKPAAAPGGTGERLTKDNNVVLSVPSGTDTANQELVFELETAKGVNVSEKAGDYVGVVVFESRIV